VIIVTIDCSKQPKLKIARSKESLKNISTIVTTIDCKNQDQKPQRTRKARRTLQQLQQPMIVAMNQHQKLQGARRVGRML